jgi:hypothetical protein
LQQSHGARRVKHAALARLGKLLRTLLKSPLSCFHVLDYFCDQVKGDLTVTTHRGDPQNVFVRKSLGLSPNA